MAIELKKQIESLESLFSLTMKAAFEEWFNFHIIEAKITEAEKILLQNAFFSGWVNGVETILEKFK